MLLLLSSTISPTVAQPSASPASSQLMYSVPAQTPSVQISPAAECQPSAEALEFTEVASIVERKIG